MKFFNLFGKDNTNQTIPETKPVITSPQWVVGTNFSFEETVGFGERVDYSSKLVFHADPSYNAKLLYLADNGGIHNSIIIGKSQLIAGTDWIIDGIDFKSWKETKSLNEIIELRTFFENGYSESWEILRSKMATDLTISGSYALLINWSYDFKRIIKTTYVPWYKCTPYEKVYHEKAGVFTNVLKYRVELGITNNQIVYKDVQAFDINAHLPNGIPQLNGARPNTQGQESKFFKDRGYNHEQLIFVKNSWPDREYYGRPTYEGVMRDINTSIELSKWQAKSIKNGFLTKALVNVETDNTMNAERAQQMADDLIENLHEQTIAVSVGPKVTISPVMIQNLDAEVKNHREDLDKKIVSGHTIPPEIVSIFIPGLLGDGDLDVKWNSFYNMVILPQKRMIESTLNMIASINGITHKIELFSKNPTI